MKLLLMCHFVFQKPCYINCFINGGSLDWKLMSSYRVLLTVAGMAMLVFPSLRLQTWFVVIL